MTHYVVWEVARVGAGVRDELLSRFAPVLGRAVEGVAILSPALVSTGRDRFLLFSRVSSVQLDAPTGSVLWGQELGFDLTPGSATCRADGLEEVVGGAPPHLLSGTGGAPVAGSGWQLTVPGNTAVPNPGAEDPRVILTPDGEPLVFFNAQWSQREERGMFLARPRAPRSPVVRLHLRGLSGVASGLFNVTQKNWVPFYHDSALHVLFSAVPLTVFRCDTALIDGACECVFAEEGGCATFTHATASRMRCSTPLVRVGGEAAAAAAEGGVGGFDGEAAVFFTLLHTSIKNKKNLKGETVTRGYTAHAALLSSSPWGWISISSPLSIPPTLSMCARNALVPAQRDLGITYPTSTLLVGDVGQGAILGFHVSDAESGLVQLEWEHGDGLGERLRRLAASPACVRRVGVGVGGPSVGDVRAVVSSTTTTTHQCAQWATLRGVAGSMELQALTRTPYGDSGGSVRCSLEDVATVPDSTLIGASIFTLRAESLKECVELCCEELLCYAFSFARASGQCTLLPERGWLQRAQKGVTSGSVPKLTGLDSPPDVCLPPPLPHGWVQSVSKRSGRPYFYHAESDASTYVRPAV